MSTNWIRVAYGPVVALLVAFTVILGIDMVSTGPNPPSIPNITFRQLSQSNDEERGQNTIRSETERFFDDAVTYRERFPEYQRNVFLATSGFGILIVLIGLALPAVVNYLRWGLALGGIVLLVYGYYVITREPARFVLEGDFPLGLLTSGEPEPLNFAGRFAMFAMSFIGLILALFLGLWRLTEWGGATHPRRTAAAAPAGAAAAPTGSFATAPAAAGASQWAPPPPASVPSYEPARAATAPSAEPLTGGPPPPGPVRDDPLRPAGQPITEWDRRGDERREV